MTPALEQALDEARSAWRFRWVTMAIAFSGALLGWLILFSLPDRYQAEASVFVDTRTALKPALKDLTVDQDVDAQINYVRESVMARPQLEKIALDTGVLDPDIKDERLRTSILNRMSDRIALTVNSAGTPGDPRSTAGSIYSIDYLDSNRSRSLLVVKTLLDTFVEQVLGGKRRGSQEAQKFLERQIADYAHRLSTAEDRLAAFKKQNVGLMPSDQGGYFTQLQNEVDASKKAKTDLANAITRRDALVKQLHGDAAISAAGAEAPLMSGRGPAGGTDTSSRIQETQAKLDELLLRFTDKHPDVIAARDTLEELKKRRAAEIESLRRGDVMAVASSGAANNPVYQSIQLELNKVEVEIAGLRGLAAQHESTVTELRKRMDSAPQVEAQYQQLNRDYDANKAEYTALLASYQKARLGEQADNAGSVRFEIVEPPIVGVTPVWPKRNKMLAVIWLFSLGAGVAAAYGLHVLRPVVNSVAGIGQLTRFPVLGVVSVAFPSQKRRQLRRSVGSFAFAAAGLLGALVVAFILNWQGFRLGLQLIKSTVSS